MELRLLAFPVVTWTGAQGFIFENHETLKNSSLAKNFVLTFTLLEMMIEVLPFGIIVTIYNQSKADDNKEYLLEYVVLVFTVLVVGSEIASLSEVTKAYIYAR